MQAIPAPLPRLDHGIPFLSFCFIFFRRRRLFLIRIHRIYSSRRSRLRVSSDSRLSAVLNPTPASLPHLYVSFPDCDCDDDRNLNCLFVIVNFNFVFFISVTAAFSVLYSSDIGNSFNWLRFTTVLLIMTEWTILTFGSNGFDIFVSISI